MSDHRFGGKSDVVFAGVEIPQIVRIVTAGNLHADLMPGQKAIAGGTPEFDDVRIGLIRFKNAQSSRIERSSVFRIAMASPHHTFRQK
jgi:hypothetical protein